MDSPLTSTAKQFLTLASTGKIDEAYQTCALPNGKHHNPAFASGFDALKVAMKQNHAQFPQKHIEFKHTVEQHDLVAIHARVILEPGSAGIATIHLFRFEDGKIAEIWDFGQPIDPNSQNTDGPF